MKYIGICGHRGAGKNSIAYLLAKTMDYIISNRRPENFDRYFKKLCTEFMYNDQLIYDLKLNDIYIASFTDDILQTIYLLTGIPVESMTSDYCKDNFLVNMETFELVPKETVDEGNIRTRSQMFSLRSSLHSVCPLLKDVHMPLRDFIIYYGFDVMQRFFGVDFWVRSLKAVEPLWGCNWDYESNYKIFIDTKTECERDYIKDKGGIIIKVTRPKHVLPNSPISKDIEFNEDYVIENTSLYDLSDTIYNIAQQIIQANEGN